MPPSLRSENGNSASAVSRLPERHPAVRDLLQELSQCLDTYTSTTGPGITSIFPQLRREFWRAASLIYITHRSNHTAPAVASSSSSSTPAPPTPLLLLPPPPSRDVRNWPAWLRLHIAEDRLIATLFPVFDPVIVQCNKKPRVAQKFTKAATDYQTRDLLLMLDLGDKICGSESALSNLARFHRTHPGVPLADVRDQLWAVVLSRASLPHDEPPVPEVRELTRAFRQLDPTWNQKGVSSGPSSVSSSSRQSSATPAPAVSRNALGKRRAADLASSENVEEEEEEEEDDDDDDPERPRRLRAKRSRPSFFEDKGDDGHINTGGLSPIQEHTNELLYNFSSSPMRFFSADEGANDDDEDDDDDKDAARMDLLERLMRLGDPTKDRKPREGMEATRCVLATVFGAARMGLRSLGKDV